MSKYDGGLVHMVDGELVIEVEEMSNAELLGELLEDLRMDKDAMGPVPVEAPLPLELTDDPTWVGEEVLKADEERCQALQEALGFKECRMKLLSSYRGWKFRRQEALDRVNLQKEVWGRMTPAQKKAHAKGFREAQDRAWADFFLARDKAREAWEDYSQVKGEVAEAESEAWETYFQIKEKHSSILGFNQWALGLLQRSEINRWDITGYGSEMHDEQWVNGDDDPSLRSEEEFQAHCEYWGSNRTWLPAKDRRRAMNQVRTSTPPSEDMEAFKALVASMK